MILSLLNLFIYPLDGIWDSLKKGTNKGIEWTKQNQETFKKGGETIATIGGTLDGLMKIHQAWTYFGDVCQKEKEKQARSNLITAQRERLMCLFETGLPEEDWLECHKKYGNEIEKYRKQMGL